MSKRKHTKARPARPQTRVTFYRRRKQLGAPQRAPEATTAAQQAPSRLEPRNMTRAQRREMIYIALKLLSQKAAAPDVDPHKWSGNGTPEEVVEFYGELWEHVGKCGFDRRDILAPQEVEERIDRTLVADLLEDVDLSDFAA